MTCPLIKLAYMYPIKVKKGFERRKKVDEAVKILHLMRLAPLLQESGVLNKLMGPG